MPRGGPRWRSEKRTRPEKGGPRRGARRGRGTQWQTLFPGPPPDASQAGSRSSVGMGTPVPKGLPRIHRPRAQPLPTLLLNSGLSGRPARSPGPWAPGPAYSPGWGQWGGEGPFNLFKGSVATAFASRTWRSTDSQGFKARPVQKQKTSLSDPSTAPASSGGPKAGLSREPAAEGVRPGFLTPLVPHSPPLLGGNPRCPEKPLWASRVPPGGTPPQAGLRAGASHSSTWRLGRTPGSRRW